MRAEKGNKVYTIDSTMKADYVARGFDIVEDDGKLIQYGAGKTVPYGDYKSIEAENIKLKEENKKLTKEVEVLKASLTVVNPEGEEESKAKGKGK